MLTVLGGLAEFERELIRARTGEGRERAKAKGVRMGRKPKLPSNTTCVGMSLRMSSSVFGKYSLASVKL